MSNAPNSQSPPHPGWPSRSLIWVVIALYVVPPLLGAVAWEISPVLGNFAGLGVTTARILIIFVGIAALMFAKRTTWTRKVVAGGFFLATWTVVLVITPILPIFMTPPGAGLSDAVRVPIGVTMLFGVTYAAWNGVRNRRWWVLLVSVVYAGVFAAAQSVLFIVMQVVGAPNLVATAGSVCFSLLMLYGGFGLFHLLGRIKGATVPPPEDHPLSSAAEGVAPVGIADLHRDTYPGYPGVTVNPVAGQRPRS